jgi:hypothetical protein
MDTLRVTALASGFFTRQDPLRVGHDDRSIARSLRSRLWVRVRPGAYTFSDLWPEEPEDRHRVLGRAVAARLGRRATLSHTTAALEHGLSVWDADLARVHVTRLDGGAGRSEAGVVHHEGLTLPSDIVEREGRLVMVPARAALETASLLSTEAAVVVLDSLLHLRRCTPGDLAASYALMESWPGMRRTRIAVRLADGRAESPGESRTRYCCYTWGLPAPEPQYDVFDSNGRLIGTTDFAWPAYGLLGEFDGKVKYERLLREGESPGDAVFREKRREERICEQLGWRMVRIVWADLYSPAATAARIHRLLRVAA